MKAKKCNGSAATIRVEFDLDRHAHNAFYNRDAYFNTRTIGSLSIHELSIFLEVPKKKLLSSIANGKSIVCESDECVKCNSIRNRVYKLSAFEDHWRGLNLLHFKSRHVIPMSNCGLHYVQEGSYSLFQYLLHGGVLFTRHYSIWEEECFFHQVNEIFNLEIEYRKMQDRKIRGNDFETAISFRHDTGLTIVGDFESREERCERFNLSREEYFKDAFILINVTNDDDGGVYVDPEFFIKFAEEEKLH